MTSNRHVSDDSFTHDDEIRAKTGIRGRRMALFGAAIGLTGLAAVMTLMGSDEKPGQISRAEASVSTDPFNGTAEMTSSLRDDGSVVAVVPPPRAKPAVAAKIEPAPAERMPAEETAAKRALVAGLAKGALARLLQARQPVESQVAGKPVQLASLGDDPTTGLSAPLTDAAGPVLSEIPPKLVPVPDKRPAVARTNKPDDKRPQKPARLAYAPTDDATHESGSLFNGLSKVFRGNGKVSLPGRGSGIAVYEISKATVHMPDGTKLEAHSGIGHMKDNPKYVYRKNRGPTPPNIYKLRMRERRFHGVEAIRMLPVDRAAMRGRDGMLTHTALLRGTNGSHGCVAFKNYAKFLKAFKSGKVKTLIVVPELDDLPVYMAAL